MGNEKTTPPAGVHARGALGKNVIELFQVKYFIVHIQIFRYHKETATDKKTLRGTCGRSKTL